MSLRILSAANVEQLIARQMIPLSELVAETGRVFHRLSHDPLSISNPDRSSVSMHAHGTLLSMPAYVSGIGASVKLVAVPKYPNESQTISPLDGNYGNQQTARRVRISSSGLAATTIVLDPSSGVPKCIINARQLTALRTAAGSLLATQLLLTTSSAPKTLVLFGAGLQIEYHAEFILSAFPSIHSCYLLTRSAPTAATTNPNSVPRASRVCARLREAHPAKRISIVSRVNEDGDEEEDDGTSVAKPDLSNRHKPLFPRSWREACSVADILVFATPSTTPLVRSSWIRAGAHLVLVGSYTPDMHEVPTSLINRASRVVVDSRDHSMREAGELIAAELNPQSDLVELGELVDPSGNPVLGPIHSARTGEITIFKSVGLAIQVSLWNFFQKKVVFFFIFFLSVLPTTIFFIWQDVMIGQMLLERAEALAIGTVIQDFD